MEFILSFYYQVEELRIQLSIKHKKVNRLGVIQKTHEFYKQGNIDYERNIHPLKFMKTNFITILHWFS